MRIELEVAISYIASYTAGGLHRGQGGGRQMRMCGDTIATLFSVCRLRGRGFDSRIGTSFFFFTPFQGEPHTK